MADKLLSICEGFYFCDARLVRITDVRFSYGIYPTLKSSWNPENSVKRRVSIIKEVFEVPVLVLSKVSFCFYMLKNNSSAPLHQSFASISRSPLHLFSFITISGLSFDAKQATVVIASKVVESKRSNVDSEDFKFNNSGRL